MNPFAWLMGGGVDEAEIRAEIWKLGVRHIGWPLEGALEELQAPNLSTHRTLLLRACVRRLRSS